MAGLNKILLIGNVGTDPEMRYTPNGNAVADFRLAVSRRFTTAAGEQREETEWFRITAWNRLAEQVNQFLSKGRRAFVEGRLTSSAFIDREGQPRASLDVTADRVLFLDRAGSAPYGDADGSASGRASESPRASASEEPEDVEQLPW